MGVVLLVTDRGFESTSSNTDRTGARGPDPEDPDAQGYGAATCTSPCTLEFPWNDREHWSPQLDSRSRLYPSTLYMRYVLAHAWY